MTVAIPDPYAILGVRRNAGQDEIKAAWRAMAKAVHPDQNREDPHAAARFAEAGRAYEVLKDPRMRNRYDQARRDADLRRMEAMKRRAEGKSAAEPPVGAETAEEAVSRIFGAETATATARPQPGPGPGPAARPAASAAPRPAAPPPAGAEAEGETPRDGMAPEAEAAAGDASAMPGGPSLLARAAAPAADLVSSLFRRILPAGSAEAPEKPAADRIPDLVCEAVATVEDLFRQRKVTATLPDGQVLKVALPPGTTDGSTLRLREQGYRQGTARGDALVGIRVARHERFRVDGLDLRTVLQISLHDAVLGCTGEVATLTGRAPVVVPPWSGPDRDLRLAGQGLPDAQGGRGNLIVELSLTLGERPDPKLVDLLRSQREGLVL